MRILVGLDGSIESERGLATVLRLVGRHCGLLVLAEVVHFEAAEAAPSAEVDAAERHLSELASDVQIAGVVHIEVLAGAPGPTLRGFAEQQDMDLLVVGRRGQGVSPPRPGYSAASRRTLFSTRQSRCSSSNRRAT